MQSAPQPAAHATGFAPPADLAAGQGDLTVETLLQAEAGRGGGNAARLAADEAAALDDPDELVRYTCFDGPADAPTAAVSRLRVDGLHCAACAGLIEQALERVDGVREARVNGSARRALVRWDPRRVKPSTLVAAVQAAGYRAYPDAGLDDAAIHDRARADSKRGLWRLFVAGFCMMQVMMYATPSYVATDAQIGLDIVHLLRWASWLLTLPVVLFAAGPFYSGAWSAIKQGRMGMDVPVVLGILATFLASTAVTFGGTDTSSVWGRDIYFDSLTMLVTFLLAGRALEQRARQKAAQALDSALNRLPSAVQRQNPEGDWTWISPIRLRQGDQVRTAVGQAFAADGVVLEGHTEVDESLVTGESRPLSRAIGEAVLAGSINLARPVVTRVSQVGADTQYQRIVNLMSQAMAQRPPVVRLADRLARPFLWGVLLLAAGGAVTWWYIDPTRALWVAVAVLIVTCPCALSLAAPSALLAAAGVLAKRGILIQRLEALEAMARADLVVFDKTGTLTDERAQVSAVHAAASGDRELLWSRAAGLASFSQHPLSRVLAQSTKPALDWTAVSEQAGGGVEGTDERGRRWRLGSASWAGVDDRLAVQVGLPHATAARVWFVCQDAAPVAGKASDALAFEMDETLRPDAAAAVASLKAHGLAVMVLSGDQDERVQAVARKLGIERAESGAQPQSKLATLEREQTAGLKVVVVGDGVNDAPVLARADASFAMAHGSALSQARADCLVLGSRPSDVAFALVLARQTMRIVRQNLWWALIYNLISLPLALSGWLPPWLAGLGMASSSLFVVLNALRVSWISGRMKAPSVTGTAAPRRSDTSLLVA